MVSFLPMLVAKPLCFAGLVLLKALGITKCITFGTPRVIYRIGVHLDRLEQWKRFEWEEGGKDANRHVNTVCKQCAVAEKPLGEARDFEFFRGVIMVLQTAHFDCLNIQITWNFTCFATSQPDTTIHCTRATLISETVFFGD
jgi:hypothetical protein